MMLNIVWVTLLLSITALAAYTVNLHPTPDELILENRETVTAEQYNFGSTPPISLGVIKSSDKAYIHLKLRFFVDTTEGYPNVFQTAPVNRGMRMEISGTTAAIVVHDSSAPSEVRGITLTNALKTGQWYALDIKALNGAFLHVKLDGKSVATYKGKGLSMETSQFLVGQGFDASRAFRGQIKDVSILKGNTLKTWSLLPYPISLSHWILIILCISAFLMTLPSSNYIDKLSYESETTSTVSVLVGYIPMYAFALVFIALGFLSVRLLGAEHLGLSKWLAHLLLPASLVVTLFAMKRTKYMFHWSRWPLGLLFLTYAAGVTISESYGEQRFDVFILNVFALSTIAFILSVDKIRLNFTLLKFVKTLPYLKLVTPISLLMLFSALSWTSLVGLTNWQSFRQVFDDNFGISIVAAFILLRTIFFIFFELSNTNIITRLNLVSIVKIKNFRYHVFLDVVVIVIFFWISFRHDSLFIISESGNSLYHWEYYVGVVQGVRNGGWLLWDTPSQYGFLNILLASIVPSASAWHSFYIFQGTLLFLVSTGIYLAARQFTPTSIFNGITVFAIVFMSLFFADPELIGPYPFPSSSVVRFFCVYALVLLVCFIPKFGMRQAIALSIFWSLAVIWSAESAVYGTAIFLFTLVALIQTNTNVNNRFALTRKYIGVAAICLTTVMVIIIAFYKVRLGVAPDLSGYFEFALGYAGGFGYVPFPLSGPGNFLFLVFMGISALCVWSIQYKSEDQDNIVAPLAAMAGCIWGIATYYIGRPVPQNITAVFPIIIMVSYLTIILARRAGAGAHSLPIKVAVIPLFFFVLIPLFNPKWISNLAKIQSFSSDISTKLPKSSDELQQLVSLVNPSQKTPVVYYGNDAVLPIFSGSYAVLNNNNWLPIPLQLLEQPVSDARRTLYLNRYICRNKPPDGILIYRNGDSIELRLEGFLSELRQFYDVEESIPSIGFILYKFSGINLQHCKVE